MPSFCAFLLMDIIIRCSTEILGQTHSRDVSSANNTCGGSIPEEWIKSLGFDLEDVNGAKRNIRKCCPWGSTFDVDMLICKKCPGYVGVNVGDYNISFGVPVCDGMVMFNVLIDGFNASVDGEGLSEEYCVDGSGESTAVVSCGDPSVVCSSRPCIRKCRSAGEFYTPEGKTTEDTDEALFVPVFYNLTTLLPQESTTVSEFGLFFGLDCEDGKVRLDSGPWDTNYLGTNGSLYVPGHREFRVYEQNEYCVEYVHGEGMFAFLCASSVIKKSETVETESVLLALGFLASCVCLLATFFMFLCSQKSKSIYRMVLLYYVGCLCIAYLSLAIAHLGNSVLNKEACTILGYSTLLSFLSAFFWLNIMSIDIWKSFRSLKAAEWRQNPNRRCRFVAYSIYGWGTPLTVTLICGMLDALLDPDSTFAVIKPNIGTESCWFSNSSYGVQAFFVIPVSLLIACNVGFFIDTALRCWKVKSEISRLGVTSGRSGGKYSMHKEQFILNIKLFIVMGVSWSPEFLSNMLPHPMWQVTDALNALLGVFIFVIFVLKKKVVRAVTQGVRDSLRSSSKKETCTDLIRDKQPTVLNECRNTNTASTTI